MVDLAFIGVFERITFYFGGRSFPTIPDSHFWALLGPTSTVEKELQIIIFFEKKKKSCVTPDQTHLY